MRRAAYLIMRTAELREGSQKFVVWEQPDTCFPRTAFERKVDESKVNGRRGEKARGMLVRRQVWR